MTPRPTTAVARTEADVLASEQAELVKLGALENEIEKELSRDRQKD